MATTEDEIVQLFRKFDVRLVGKPLDIPAELKQAGVLVPLYREDGCWKVLLTLRPKHMRTHAGNVAFPGGRMDKEDTDIVCTALRESEEEIGLDRKDVNVLAVLPASYVRPNNIVTPVIGIIPNDFVPKKNDAEVEKVFSLPLSRFLKSDYTKGKFEMEPGMYLYFYTFVDVIDGEEVKTWGYTARTLMKAALVILKSDNVQYDTSAIPITRDNAFEDSEKSVTRLAIEQVRESKL